jgi:hypothetical protein
MAMLFDETQYLAHSYTFTNNGGAYWSAWVKPLLPTTSQTIAMISNGTNEQHLLSIDASGRFTFSAYDGAWRTATDPSVAKIGRWYHVMGSCHNSTVMRLFVDGVEVATYSTSGSINSYSTMKVYIGTNTNGTAKFRGWLHDVVYVNAGWGPAENARIARMIAHGQPANDGWYLSQWQYMRCWAPLDPPDPFRDLSPIRGYFDAAVDGFIRTERPDDLYEHLHTSRHSFSGNTKTNFPIKEVTYKRPGQITTNSHVITSSPSYIRNTACKFASASDYINLGTTGPSGATMSFAAWVKLLTTAKQLVVGKWGSGSGEQAWGLYAADDFGKPLILVGNGSAQNGATGPESLKLNRWYHIAGTHGVRGLQLYINGQLTATGSAVSNIISPTIDIRVGQRSGGASGGDVASNLHIGSVSVWYDELTPNEIVALSQGQAPDPLRRRLYGSWTLGQIPNMVPDVGTVVGACVGTPAIVPGPPLYTDYSYITLHRVSQLTPFVVF